MSSGSEDTAPLAACTRLTHLQLSLGGNSATRLLGFLPSVSASLRHFDLHWGYCTPPLDLTQLAGLTALEQLKLQIENSTDPLDLSPLAACNKIRDLYLSRCCISDISPLSELVELRSLVMYHNRLQPLLLDLTPLAACTKLHNLSIQRACCLRDISPLSALASSLCDLSLRGCVGVGDISPLSGLTGLQHLDLDACLRNVQYWQQQQHPGQQAIVPPLSVLLDLSPLSGLTRLLFLGLTAWRRQPTSRRSPPSLRCGTSTSAPTRGRGSAAARWTWPRCPRAPRCGAWT